MPYRTEHDTIIGIPDPAARPPLVDGPGMFETAQERLDRITRWFLDGKISRHERELQIVETYLRRRGRMPTMFELAHAHDDLGRYRSCCAACDADYDRNVSS